MSNNDEERLGTKFWNALDNSPFMMLGLKGSGYTRPMTAQVDEDRQIYFFASRDEELVKGLSGSTRALATYASKGHDLFATVEGQLVVDNDREKIDRLWSPMVAAWYEDGKDDPKLVLLRFEAETADVWEASAGSALKATLLKLVGRQPDERLQQENHAEVAV